MRLIDADVLLEELKLSSNMQAENSREFSLLHNDIVIVNEQPTVTAIPVQFITDKINSLEYLQKKMAAWTTPELEIQIQTLVNLISDYAQIARSKE